MEDFFKTSGVQLDRTANFNLRLFIPIINVVANDVYHDGAFWGIRFPVSASSFYETAVYVIEENLEGRGDAVLKACL